MITASQAKDKTITSEKKITAILNTINDYILEACSHGNKYITIDISDNYIKTLPILTEILKDKGYYIKKYYVKSELKLEISWF